MKRITHIKQISSNKYSLTIDDKKHIVYDDVLLQYNILKAKEITDEEYNRIVKANNYHEGYNKSLKFILAKQRTESELRDKLRSLSVGKDDIDKIISRLRQEKYLDDEKYVQSYINDQVLLKLNGPKKIFLELKRLGFNEILINSYLDKVDKKVWAEKVTKIFEKKCRMSKNLSKKMLLMKLKKDYQNLGYMESDYQSLLDNIEYDESGSITRDYQKLYDKLSKKYEGERLKLMIKQKLYQLGYSLEKIETVL